MNKNTKRICCKSFYKKNFTEKIFQKVMYFVDILQYVTKTTMLRILIKFLIFNVDFFLHLITFASKHFETFLQHIILKMLILVEILSSIDNYLAKKLLLYTKIL